MPTLPCPGKGLARRRAAAGQRALACCGSSSSAAPLPAPSITDWEVSRPAEGTQTPVWAMHTGGQGLGSNSLQLCHRHVELSLASVCPLIYKKQW